MRNSFFQRRLVLALLPLTGLFSGCSAEVKNWAENQPIVNERASDRLAAHHVNVRLVSFVDARLPVAYAQKPDDDIIYEYTPEQLTQGNLMDMLQAYVGNNLPEVYNPVHNMVLDVKVKNVRTAILEGSLMTGSFGRYVVQIDAEVKTVNTTTNNQVFKSDVSVTTQATRGPSGGRHPSEAMDELAMRQLLKQAGQDFANKVVREIASRF
jgi:hypothetical protein